MYKEQRFSQFLKYPCYFLMSINWQRITLSSLKILHEFHCLGLRPTFLKSRKLGVESWESQYMIKQLEIEIFLKESLRLSSPEKKNLSCDLLDLLKYEINFFHTRESDHLFSNHIIELLEGLEIQASPEEFPDCENGEVLKLVANQMFGISHFIPLRQGQTLVSVDNRVLGTQVIILFNILPLQRL